ncbi:hypothetical protein J3R30DRAFT_3855854 [Lentinula aciculospora]|uniref:VWFA domain-containing protein n=1 Tax=Lentinula aciculospora TaxID=153920 RepID=A0A9W9AIE3_9AGAR|nr:hypothetical protein J3R30DRAFT_3413023 [Lentinula aciculospora]KAJ4482608.1 hypothetical protein J3R30DRAFT_3855854 [Lentinula aciculospora]
MPLNNNQLLLGPFFLRNLVFVLDCTGSIGSYIRSAEQGINNIVNEILHSAKLASPSDIRVRVQAYRDVDRFVEFLTKPFRLTSDISKVQNFLKHLGANGGGDGPEAVATVLDRTLNEKNELQWLPADKAAHKIIVHITDALPHGIAEDGDKYPKGEPDTGGIFAANILNTDKIMKGNNVNYVHFLNLSYPVVKWVNNTRATTLTGYMLSLTHHGLLPNAITALALESLDLDVALEEMKKELGDLKKGGGPLSTSFAMKTVGGSPPTAAVAPSAHTLFMSIAEPEAPPAPLSDDELQAIMNAAETPDQLETFSKAIRPNPADAVKTVHKWFTDKGTKIRTLKTNIEYHYTGNALHNWNIMEKASSPADLVGGLAVPEGVPLSSTAEQSMELAEEPITEKQVERMTHRYRVKYGSKEH